MSEEEAVHTHETDEEAEEITVEITEDNLICLQGSDFELHLTPDDARELASLLNELADEADNGEGGDDEPEAAAA